MRSDRCAVRATAQVSAPRQNRVAVLVENLTLLSGATLDVTSGYTLSSYALGKGIVVLGMKLAGFVAATNVRPPMMRAGAPNDGTASRSRPIWCCKPLLSWKILTGAQSPARFGFKPNAQVTPLRG